MDFQLSDHGQSRSCHSSKDARTQIAPSRLPRSSAKPFKARVQHSVLAGEDSAGWRRHSCLCSGVDLASLLSCPDFCPACPLRGCNSLASCSRNGSLFSGRFSPAQVDFSECCEGSGYAVQFVLKSHAFLLEFADHRLHQVLWHPESLSPAFGHQGGSYESSIRFR